MTLNEFLKQYEKQPPRGETFLLGHYTVTKMVKLIRELIRQRDSYITSTHYRMNRDLVIDKNNAALDKIVSELV